MREPGEPEWLEQMWFAGNHSDIGGSYGEDESRLSDIALGWMVEQATSLPHPLIEDGTNCICSHHQTECDILESKRCATNINGG